MINPKFKEKIKEIRKKVEEVPFFILIWGPGEGNETIVRQKRLKLKEILSNEFGSENVIFPEDEDFDFQKWIQDWGHYAKEFYEAFAADAIIVLAESIGSITEIALYREYIAEKVIIFVKKRPPEHEGFAKQAYNWLNVQAIEPEEWDSCERIRRLSFQFLERLRIEKFKSTTVS